MKTEHPLIIVFYMDRDMMASDFMPHYVESVNQMIADKKLNMLAFFIPCAEGEQERLECINPIIVDENEMTKITKLVSDIKNQFSINADINLPDVEITLDNKCDCNDNCECKK